MSEAVSALDHAVYQHGIAEAREIGLQGMITLRGDLSSAKIKSVVKAAVNLPVPKQRQIGENAKGGVAWMSPDELLVMCPYDTVNAVLANMTKTLGKTHGVAVNVSDARAVFELSGKHARDVMAKLAPTDMSVDAFQPGTIRRTRMAQVPAAFWMSSSDTFRIICFRSVADYVFGILKMAAQPGSEVGYFD